MTECINPEEYWVLTIDILSGKLSGVSFQLAVFHLENIPAHFAFSFGCLFRFLNSS
jgi:hypothetical protein